jgi:hypothetical protein
LAHIDCRMAFIGSSGIECRDDRAGQYVYIVPDGRSFLPTARCRQGWTHLLYVRDALATELGSLCICTGWHVREWHKAGRWRTGPLIQRSVRVVRIVRRDVSHELLPPLLDGHRGCVVCPPTPRRCKF